MGKNKPEIPAPAAAPAQAVAPTIAPTTPPAPAQAPATPTPAEAPPAQPIGLQTKEEKMANEFGSAAGLKTAEIARVKAYLKDKRLETKTSAAGNLAELRAQVESDDKVHGVILGIETKLAISDFITKVKFGDFDFKGENNEAAKVEENLVFKEVKNSLVGLLGELSPENGPITMQKQWMEEISRCVLAELKAYIGTFGGKGEMDLDAVRKFFAVVRDPAQTSVGGQAGIGSFEDWFQKIHKTEYNAWHAEKGRQKSTLAQKEGEESTAHATLESVKVDLKQTLAPIQAKFAALPATIMPEALTAEATALAAQIDAATDSAKKVDIEGAITAFGAKLAPFEELAKDPAAAEIPPEKCDAIFAKVKSGEKSPVEAKAMIAQEKAASDAAMEEADSADTPMVDKLFAWANKAEEGSTWKTALTGIAKLLSGLLASLAGVTWIGDKVRNSGLISNKMLAEQFHDEKAAVALKVEKQFRAFRLTRAIANKIGPFKTKDVVKALREKPGEVVADTAMHPKLQRLAERLTQNGGDTSEKTVFEFMGNNPSWKEIKSPEEPAQTPAAPLVASANAPAAAPTAATGTPPAGAPASTPPKTNS
ncbi:hypothetical protein HZA42_05530 [Candidatus Peregrinibacteria bacterium]|nr:hypothetical protein [Candidatus Peregrinibacteria bacterium]